MRLKAPRNKSKPARCRAVATACDALEPRRLLSGITFSSLAYPLQATPAAVAVGDFNNDGVPDLVTDNTTSMSVLLGNGDGTFKAATTFQVGGTNYSIAVGDFNGDGNQDLVTANKSGFLNVLLGNGNGTFKYSYHVADGLSGGPVYLATGDFNGDGDLDIAAASSGGTVSILLGNGDGTFKAPQVIQLSGTLTGIVAADFTGDGDLDIAAANSTNDAVDILLGNGNGTFQPAQTVSLGHRPTAIAAGFINGDGFPDIVTTNYDNSVSILLGNGDGTFQTAQTLTNAGGSALALGDINGYGAADVLAEDNSTLALDVSLGNGDGTFQPVESAGNLAGLQDMVVADLNGDDCPDIVLANNPVSRVTVLLNTTTFPATPLAAPLLCTPGNGSTGAAVAPTFSWSPQDASTYRLIVATNPADLPSDPASTAGGPSVVLDTTTSATSLTPSSALSLNTTYYWEVIGTTAGRGGTWSAVGSFTTTGQTALAATPVTAELPSGSASNLPTFGWPTVAGATQYRLIVATDQGDLPANPAATTGGSSVVIDVATTANQFTPATPLDNGTTYFFEVIATNVSQGGTWSSVGSYRVPEFSFSNTVVSDGSVDPGQALLAADFNGDGIPDLISGNPARGNIPDNSLNVMLGNGNGTFQTPLLTGIYSPLALASGDFNGDGKADLAAVGYGDISILLGNGDGTFQLEQTISTPVYPGAVAMGDFTGDGRLDIAYALEDGAHGHYSAIDLLLGNGDGTFNPTPLQVAPHFYATSLATADFRDDGKEDLIAANSTEMAVFLGNGDGTFMPAEYYPVSNLAKVAVGDVNGDGNADIVMVSGGTSPTVSVLLGNGNGTFRAGQSVQLGNTQLNPGVLFINDFNGDGKPDIAVVTYSDLVLLPGNGDGTFQAPQFIPWGYGLTGAASADFTGDGKPDIVIDATDDKGVMHVLLNTTTVPTPLAAPTPASPPQGSNDQSLMPTFSWSAVSGAADYRIIVATNPADLPADPSDDIGGQSVVIDTTTATTTFTPSTALVQGTTYYWEVIGLNSGQAGTWSAISHFVAGPANLPAPIPKSPANQSAGVLPTASFKWSAVSGATSYRLIVATALTDLPTDPAAATGGAGVVIDATTSLRTYTPSTALSLGTTYYWEVDATAPGQGGVWSTILSFTTATPQGPPSGGYTPAMILQAYGINQVSFNGAGQTIAVVDNYNNPNIKQDLRAFDTHFNLPAPPKFTVVDENGNPISPKAEPPPPSNETGWISEIDLDVEWVHALAPAASILLVETLSTTDLVSAIETAAAYPGVSVVSMSFESSTFSGDASTLFATPQGHIPVTFVAASGDTGIYATISTNGTASTANTPGVGYPAGFSNVLAVGGTNLDVLDSAGDWGSESLWSVSSSDGSGYGVNSTVPEPSYQTAAVTASGRSVPDVSFDGNPNTGVATYDSYDDPANPWTEIAGTSFSAPAWGAVIALVDQGRNAAGLNGLDTNTALPLLYSLPLSDFHKTGPSQYNTGTGLGTPIANKLIPDLINAAATLNHGVLSVNGAGGNDTIDLSVSDGVLTVDINGSDSLFENSQITSIDVTALLGNNSVTLGTGVIGASVLGGNGADTIQGGDGNDTLNGGAGADSINGGAGNDSLVGGKGSDTLNGGAGSDTLVGGNGYDSLIGGNGPDSLFGGPGDDTLFGGKGSNTLVGGTGDNQLIGGPGNDLFYANNNMADTLFGGGGNDTAYVDPGGLDLIPNNDIGTILD